MTLSRRRFLGAMAGAGAAVALPGQLSLAYAADPDRRAAAELTTLVQRLVPGAANELGYRPLRTVGGEPHVVREALAKAKAGRAARRVSLLSFIHLTDQHIIDVQSPSRVEFLDRYAFNECEPIPFSSAFRPQEAACARIADAMNRRIRRLQVSPVTGAPIAAAICTGDNTDNQQRNELDWYMAVMDGGRLAPNSGDPTRYEGVQASGSASYWHPDPAVNDSYKRVYGFPSRERFLEDALDAFRAAGVGLPWYTCYGNHDGLAQGNAPALPAFEAIGVGPVKVVGAPAPANPCEHFQPLDEIPAGAVVQPTTPDPARAYVSRKQWIARHFESTGAPVGHGFTKDNVDRNLAYYATDVGPLRFITLDTVNPGGLDSGSIGEAQLTWLEGELAKAQQRRQLVMLFSHHGLRSLENPNEAPDPLHPEDSDLPRRRADEVLGRISKFSCVIAWVNGHTHENVITPRTTFWDIGTAAHIDWPAQARVLDVVDNRDGTLSIFTTVFDHEDDPIASFARELAANDPQKGYDADLAKAEDRNTELLLRHPFAAGGGGGGGAGGGGGQSGPGGDGGGGLGAQGVGRTLPATGGGSAITLGGALAVAAGAAVVRGRSAKA